MTMIKTMVPMEKGIYITAPGPSSAALDVAPARRGRRLETAIERLNHIQDSKPISIPTL
jgi:hypothetical protein